MEVTTIPMTMVARTTIAARAIRGTRAVTDRRANRTAAKSKRRAKVTLTHTECHDFI